MIAGVGIHSGGYSRVRLHRVDGPNRFRRGSSEIPVGLNAVRSAERCVTLAGDGVAVATVEHLLAALHVTGFWSGVLIEVDSDELPILDGSALPWQQELGQLGDPPPPPPPLIPMAPIRVAWNSGTAELEPGPTTVDVSVTYPHPSIGEQRWSGGPERWHELLDARTFGFLHEVESLRAAGLAMGADLGNAIVYDDDGPMSPLRHADEPVRHKALDLIGDLALLGKPIAAAIRVDRGSHRLHLNLMRQLSRNLSPLETL